MELNNESKTLFIPLYGKALMSKRKIFIYDPKAEEIIESVNFKFDKLKQSKWLSMYMATRARKLDEICSKHIQRKPNTTVIHLGCGLDSRCMRVNHNSNKWYDIDYPNVIELRKKFYTEDDKYRMIGKSVTDLSWLNEIDGDNSNILIVAEGLTMYLSENEIQQLLKGINERFESATLLFDAYSKKAVESSKIKNPVNQMNANVKWGMNTPEDFKKLNHNLELVREYLIRHKENNLKGMTKFIFENLYCGKISESLYKIYEFELKKGQEKTEELETKIIYFVHGTTVDNVAGKCSGWKQAELTDLGKERAIGLGKIRKDTHFDIIFTSDLIRAIDSANLAFPNVEHIQDVRLRECNYGNLDGKDKSLIIYEEHIYEPFPNGESLKDVEKRIEEFIFFLKENYKGKTIGIVAHRAPQLAFEVLTKNISWEEANKNDWRKAKMWQPGWEYIIK